MLGSVVPAVAADGSPGTSYHGQPSGPMPCPAFGISASPFVNVSAATFGAISVDISHTAPRRYFTGSLNGNPRMSAVTGVADAPAATFCPAGTRATDAASANPFG